MKPLSAIAFLLAASFLMLSCGTGKKLEAANAQVATLTTRVNDLNKQVTDEKASIDQLNAETARLKKENIQYGKEAEDCRKTKAAINQRVENLHNALEERGTSMKEIREKVRKALTSFIEQGAEVEYKQGLVHIAIPDKLAFPSGSTKVSDAGRQVMSVVADVLIENPHVTAIIIGNTDSVKVNKGFTDNWSLSTERANTMVRVLRDTYMVDAARLTSAGKGKYNPVGDNRTAQGRALNRRTDIILNPDLSRLWELSESK